MATTHTYALLEVPGVVFAAVKAMLTRAGSTDAIHEAEGPGDKELIDMHGLALVARPGSKQTGVATGMVEVGTLLSHRTGQGRVEIAIGAEVAQWDIGDAKKVHAMLGEAIEAAISDELIFKFLTEKVGIAPENPTISEVVFYRAIGTLFEHVEFSLMDSQLEPADRAAQRLDALDAIAMMIRKGRPYKVGTVDRDEANARWRREART